jgi:hypothetical protein
MRSLSSGKAAHLFGSAAQPSASATSRGEDMSGSMTPVKRVSAKVRALPSTFGTESTERRPTANPASSASRERAMNHDTSKLHDCGKVGSFRITRHAIERYMERAGQTRAHRALAKIIGLIADSIPCDQQRGWRYSRGWLLVVDGTTIITVMRPNKRHAMDAIFRAVNKTPP